MGKIKITIEDLFNIPGAVIYNPDVFKSTASVVIDSRKIKKGSIFFAIKGEKFDGHDFVLTAINKGAGAIVINENKLRKFSSLKIPFIAVPDTTKAFGDLANVWRKKLSAIIISITGSNGKTTTKEMTTALLSEKFSVVKTEANNNNHIGVPLTIFSADEKCGALVLEQGTNHFGEIAYSAKISEPDFAVMTNIGDSHLEFLKNREGVYKEKSALLDVTENLGGKVLLNTDDPIVKKYSRNYSNKITFGFGGKVDVKGKIVGFTEDGRTKIEVSYKNKKLVAELPVYGESSAKNFLTTCAVAFQMGLSNKEILSGAKKLKAVHGRLEVKKFDKAFIIDDTYNASPASVESGYELVKKIKTFKNKIVVLGDIYELGKQAPKLHKDLSKLFKPDKNLFVLTVGNMMQNLHKELRKKKVRSIHFHLREALALYLQYEEIDNSAILVKGSRGMKMEEFVNILEKRFE